MTKTPDFDPAQFRENPKAIARYLTEAFDKNDLGAVVLAINLVMRAQNVLALAEATGLRRDRLYKTFGGNVNPQLGRVMELFAGLDVQLVVKPLPPKAKAPRPKLGRPSKVNETPSAAGHAPLEGGAQMPVMQGRAATRRRFT
jgi:probable addiction module antidote protein